MNQDFFGGLDFFRVATRAALHGAKLFYICKFRGNLTGWFPKGWFWRMFPRDENRNEGTFAKTTLLETALLSPNDPFWC